MKSGDIYRHYKGPSYRIVCTGYDHEGRAMVAYESLTDGKIWFRLKDDFEARIMKESVAVARFTKVTMSKESEKVDTSTEHVDIVDTSNG